MTRIITTGVDNLSSRPALGGDGGGVNTQAGSRGAGTQTNPHAANVIPFLPRARSWRTSASSNSRASSHELSILDHDRAALCALSIMIGFTLLAIGLLMFAGSLLFGFFDLG